MSEVERFPRRTSETHPLRIDAVLVPGATGRIGMTLGPIVTGAAPGARFEDTWPAVGDEARAVLRDGGSVLLHCRAGLGRTGTVAASLFVDFGMEPETAIDAVHAARPKTIETWAQLVYVRSLRPPNR